jgi:hypothetical protein
LCGPSRPGREDLHPELLRASGPRARKPTTVDGLSQALIDPVFSGMEMKAQTRGGISALLLVLASKEIAG